MIREANGELLALKNGAKRTKNENLTKDQKIAQGNQTPVDFGIRTRSRIETHRRSPRVNEGKGEKRNVNRLNKEDMQKNV